MSAVGMRMLQALTAAVLVAILTGCSSVIIDVTRFNVFLRRFGREAQILPSQMALAALRKRCIVA